MSPISDFRCIQSNIRIQEMYACVQYHDSDVCSPISGFRRCMQSNIRIQEVHAVEYKDSGDTGMSPVKGFGRYEADPKSNANTSTTL